LDFADLWSEPRPLKLTAEKNAAASLAMRDRGDMTMSQIARALGVGRTTLV
jgi:AcrR family transcriptional regulator